MSIRTLGMALAIGALMLPTGSANHGIEGVLVATLDDGSAATARLTYITGNFNTQTWAFSWTTSGGAQVSCNAFGSLEVGFTSLPGCATSFATGPTGDSHTYPNANPDAHEVTVTFGGVAGSGQQVLCPDAGNQGFACQTVLSVL